MTYDPDYERDTIPVALNRGDARPNYDHRLNTNPSFLPRAMFNPTGDPAIRTPWGVIGRSSIPVISDQTELAFLIATKDQDMPTDYATYNRTAVIRYGFMTKPNPKFPNDLPEPVMLTNIDWDADPEGNRYIRNSTDTCYCDPDFDADMLIGWNHHVIWADLSAPPVLAILQYTRQQQQWTHVRSARLMDIDGTLKLRFAGSMTAEDANALAITLIDRLPDIDLDNVAAHNLPDQLRWCIASNTSPDDLFDARELAKMLTDNDPYRLDFFDSELHDHYDTAPSEDEIQDAIATHDPLYGSTKVDQDERGDWHIYYTLYPIEHTFTLRNPTGRFPDHAKHTGACKCMDYAWNNTRARTFQDPRYDFGLDEDHTPEND